MNTLLKDIDDDLFFFDEKTKLAVVSLNGFYGAINQNGDIIIPFIYDYAMYFSDELLAVKKNNKWGYVDENNIVIIPFEYDNIINFTSENDDSFMKNDTVLGWSGHFNNDKTIVCKNGKLGLINKQNEVLAPFKYKTISSYNEKYACVSLDNRKYGLVDYHNNVIIPFDYDYLSLVGDYINFGVANDILIENQNETSDLLVDCEEKLIFHGLMNLHQEIIVPTISSTAIVNYVNNNAMCFDKHRNEYFIYNSLSNESTYADESLSDESKLNFIRNLVDLPIIEQYN
ncbi:WG repeat-containing protein [Empedobacter falsenii]|uniref:WG repeat-containing protein n=1 Tax=Empedobacter falsenii TaxID=343874 RepID=A0AAW7DJH2_9FLAO|nr:WG repeat-containing protein [Empedobacter falsenii]MDM1551631.1 WG repeat-containing protein [Empedobacter falsenii]